jgi:hypothetical protein
MKSRWKAMDDHFDPGIARQGKRLVASASEPCSNNRTAHSLTPSDCPINQKVLPNLPRKYVRH